MKSKQESRLKRNIYMYILNISFFVCHVKGSTPSSHFPKIISSQSFLIYVYVFWVSSDEPSRIIDDPWLSLLWLSRFFRAGHVEKVDDVLPSYFSSSRWNPLEICTVALLAVPQSQSNYFSFTLSSTNLRSIIKDYGGELLLDEAVDNLATEKKCTQVNLCRTLTNLKPHPFAKFSRAYGPGDVPPCFSTLPCQANSRVSLQQWFYLQAEWECFLKYTLCAHWSSYGGKKIIFFCITPLCNADLILMCEEVTFLALSHEECCSITVCLQQLCAAVTRKPVLEPESDRSVEGEAWF